MDFDALVAANPSITNINSVDIGQTINIPAGGAIVVTGFSSATQESAFLWNRFGATDGPMSATYQRLAHILGMGEGNYESYNTGTRRVRGGVLGHSYTNRPVGTVTGRTINQILSTDSLPGTNRKRMFAVGAYQITIPTLRNAVAAMNLTGDELLTPRLQDQIFEHYLVPTAGDGALGRFMTSGAGTVDQAQFAAAQQWASIAVPAGYRTQRDAISNGMMSYYGGPANRANLNETQALRSLLSNLKQLGH